METMLASMLWDLWGQVSVGRMVESVVLLMIIWKKIRPHIEILEKRLLGVETGVKHGFNLGNRRFKKAESRLKQIESKLGIETPEDDPEEDEHGTYQQGLKPRN